MYERTQRTKRVDETCKFLDRSGIRGIEKLSDNGIALFAQSALSRGETLGIEISEHYGAAGAQPPGARASHSSCTGYRNNLHSQRSCRFRFQFIFLKGYLINDESSLAYVDLGIFE